MKHKKSALFNSLISLLLCISMLVGTTFAWFTDYVVTGINTIAAGVLDVELYHSNATVTDEQVTSATKLFMDLQGKPILWEPGVVSYENLRITNAGDLALMYQLAINTANENFVVDPSGEQYGLSQILKVGVVEGGITATDRAGVVASVKDGDWTTLGDFLRDGSLLPEGAGESEDVWGIVVYWVPGENDNFWNLNNGKTLNEGDILSIDLGISLVATQEQFESDSFGDDYDASAKSDVFPDFVGGSASTNVTPNGQNQVASEVKMTNGLVAATVPAGVQLAEGTTELTLSVSNMSASGSNIILGENEAMRSLDVHIEGVAENNTVPMTIKLAEAAPTGLNMGNYKLFHVENGNTVEMTLVESGAAFTAHNQFKYDPATGDLTLYMATFSEVSVVADTTKAWEGGVDHNWYDGKSSPYTIANADQLWSFSQIVGGMAKDADGNAIARDSFSGKTVKLISDINLGDAEASNDTGKIFYPIGYWNNEGTYERKPLEERTTAVESGLYAFQGIFDGQGHTISNFYQNTWEMKGDHNWYDPIKEQYYRDGMGLFGKVYGGTVKNLTVTNFSSDGEITTTGVIAAYADFGATFENIAITNCNPRVYNIGNGGIVGCVGWYTAGKTDKKVTFTNITVDNSNKISALWGSYDVACGGIVGQYYPTSGQTSSGTPKNAGIDFVNCHVAAQMDVYNDVCGNYQYYAYRYAGMMIGSIRENTTNKDGKTIPDMTGISATGCTVNYGDWNDYYYCEFEKNGHPSYSGPDDYKFSRVPDSELSFTDSNGNGKVDANERTSVTGCKHNHTDAENNKAIYLPFHQLFTGYGWGVSSIGLEKYSGIVTNLDITESDQEESVLKFDCAFPGSSVNEEGVVQTKFLYRVGNQNTVNVGSLFAVKAGATINSSGAYVTITSQHDDNIIMGSFTAATADKNGDSVVDWKDGQVKFDQTGVVKVTIQDYDYCIPTVLYLEVVDAYNRTTASFGGNSVLLNDVSTSSTLSTSGIIYGNGFTVNMENAPITEKNGAVFHLYDGAVLKNLKIVGKEFTTVATNVNDTNYGVSTVRAWGTVTIEDSYISGCRSAVSVTGTELTIKNSVIANGVYANIDFRSGILNLHNVTTINEPHSVNGTTILGLGIVGNMTASAGRQINITGNLTQYNWVSKADCANIKASGVDSIFNSVFTENKYASLRYTYNNTSYVNTGILSLCSDFGANSVTGAPTSYTGMDVTATISSVSVDGYVWSPGQSGTLTADDMKYHDLEYAPESGEGDQGTAYIPPDFDFAGAGLEAESGVVQISYESGSSYILSNDTLKKLLTAEKYGQPLSYTINMEGNDYTNSDIIFNAAETKIYTITYTITDNLIYDDEGKLTETTYEVTKDLKVFATVVDKGADAPAFTFYYGTNGDVSADTPHTTQPTNSYTSTIKQIGETYYIMPNVSATSANAIGSQIVDGTTVYYPIVDGINVRSGNTADYDFTRYYPIFKAVKISDNGTEYSYSGTTKMPATVAWVEATIDSGNGASALNDGFGLYNNQYLCKIQKKAGDAESGGTSVVKFSYTALDGNTYYYYVGFRFYDEEESSGCFTEGTLITLADGTQKAVEDLNVGDMVLAFNHVSGQFEAAPIIFNTHTDEAEAREHDVLHLEFANGSEVEIVESHGLFDMTLMQYVYVDYTNYQDYIGHEFYFAGENGEAAEAVTLENAYIVKETVRIFCPVSYFHMNSIANGFLNTPNIPGDITGLVNYFEYDPDLKYNEAAMQRDIEKYGLYTYADFSDYISEAAYNSSPAVHLKVAVGKGMITFEEILGVIEYLLAGSLIE